MGYILVGVGKLGVGESGVGELGINRDIRPGRWWLPRAVHWIQKKINTSCWLNKYKNEWRAELAQDRKKKNNKTVDL